MRVACLDNAAQGSERALRHSRGPRQPGGGRQSAGPRHAKRFVRRHPEARAERRAKSAAADPAFRKPKSAKPEFGPGVLRGPSDDGEQKIAPAPMPATVQNVAVTADEAGMRVDRFFEARFPGLSFSH